MKRLAASLLLLVSLSFSIVASAETVTFDFAPTGLTGIFPSGTNINVKEYHDYTVNGIVFTTYNLKEISASLNIYNGGYLTISRRGAKIIRIKITTNPGVTVTISANDGTSTALSVKTSGTNYEVPENEQVKNNIIKLSNNNTNTSTDVKITKLEIEYEDVLQDAELSFDKQNYRAYYEQNSFENQPTLSNPYNVPVAFSSSDNLIVTVDEQTGEIESVNAIGTATITAKFTGNENYKPGVATYDFEVYKNNDEYVLTINNSVTSVSYGVLPITVSNANWTLNDFNVHKGDGFITCGYNGGPDPWIWLRGCDNQQTISQPISEVDVYIEVIDPVNFNSITLKRSEKSDGSFEEKDSFSGEANSDNSVIRFSIPDPQANLTYRLKFTCSQTANGSVKVKKVVCKSVGHIRTGLTEGRWASVCLPYNVTEVIGADVYMLSHKTVVNNVVTSIEVAKINAGEPLKAGKPYFIRANGEGDVVLKYDYTEPMATAPGTDGHGYYGVFEDTKIGDTGKFDKGVYMMSSNVLRRATAGSTCKANRAYIVLDEVRDNSPVPEAMGRQIESIGAEKGTTTAIGETSVDAATDQVIYDLQGRRVVNPTDGIYVINGKKVNLQK